MENHEKVIVGLTEKVTIHGKDSREVEGRIDTGATKSSIDAKLAAELVLGPVVRKKLVKSASGIELRPLVKVRMTLLGKTIDEEFTIADRSSMKYDVLIGQDVLKQGFMIDPNKGDDQTATEEEQEQQNQKEEESEDEQK